jgi:hypothetical protein
MLLPRDATRNIGKSARFEPGLRHTPRPELFLAHTAASRHRRGPVTRLTSGTEGRPVLLVLGVLSQLRPVGVGSQLSRQG